MGMAKIGVPIDCYRAMKISPRLEPRRENYIKGLAGLVFIPHVQIRVFHFYYGRY